jgi:hypothetical protein
MGPDRALDYSWLVGTARDNETGSRPTKGDTMYIVATHTISRPDKFWAAAKTLQVPPHLKLHTVFPSTDGAKASCLWEGDSLPTVKQFVETITSGLASNEYMPVEAANALGLPK